jgi:hypothetical protein
MSNHVYVKENVCWPIVYTVMLFRKKLQHFDTKLQISIWKQTHKIWTNNKKEKRQKKS